MTAARPVVCADVAAVILAGGAATRMGGRAKLLLEVEGETVLARQLAVLGPRVTAIAISTNEPALYEHAGLPMILDDNPGDGPLAGIAAGLAWCRRPYLLVVAGDMPRIQPAVIDRLLSRRAPGVDAVAVRVRPLPVVAETAPQDAPAPLPEPLLAVYGARCLHAVRRRLAAGHRKTAGVLTDEGLTVRWIEEPELRAIDPALRSLANVNAPADL